MLSSLQNPRVQAARRLRRRASRASEGACLAEGPHVVGEALEAGAEVLEVFAGPGFEIGPIADLAGTRAIPVRRASDHVIAALSETTTPQGIVAVVRVSQAALEDVISNTDLMVMLAGVRDPGNAGTLVRSAVAAGAGGVVFAQETVDVWAPKTIRAAAGAVFRVPVITGTGLEATAGSLRRGGFRLVGADARAATSYDSVDFTKPTVVVVGNEAWGVSEAAVGAMDDLVGIPMPGPAESLNAGIAGSILLFEAVRQRRCARVYPLAT